MKSIELTIALVTLIWCLGASPTYAQAPEQKQEQAETVSVNTSLVTLPVRVTDSTGHFVTGLKQSDFQVFEDGKPQEISSFFASETPFNVALLLDTSRSTRNWLSTIRKSALSFIKQLKPEDRVLVVTFDELVTFRRDFTSNRQTLEKEINLLKSGYSTAVYDAISRTISEKFSSLNGRKAIVILTDGKDTWSKQASCKSTLDLITHTDIPIYSIQYDAIDVKNSSNSPCMVLRDNLPAYVASSGEDVRREIERRILATTALRAISQRSGARHLVAGSIENLEQTFALIADELRHQYTLVYYPANEHANDGYHTIEVRLKQTDLLVHTRPGYQVSRSERQD